MATAAGATIEVIKYLTDLGVSPIATDEVHIIDVTVLATVPQGKYYVYKVNMNTQSSKFY